MLFLKISREPWFKIFFCINCAWNENEILVPSAM